MIHTKYNFRKYLRNKYPDVTAEAVYGIPAYILDKPLSPEDMQEYGISQFNDGKYIVFIGLKPQQAMDLLHEFIENGIPVGTRGREHSNVAPTTYASFQDYLFRNQVQFKHRTYSGKIKPSDYLLSPDAILLNNEERSWYIYEFVAGDIPESHLLHVPHGTVINTDKSLSTIVFIKAPMSSYKSRKQLRAENFKLMNPLYEQIAVACDKGDWDKAVALVETYKSIAFESEQTCDKNKLKDAWSIHALAQYLQIPEPFTPEQPEQVTSDEEMDKDFEF